EIGRDLLAMAVRGLFTGDLNDTSFLNLLFLAHSHGSLDTLFSIEDGAQENMVDGGAGVIAQRLAATLDDAIRLESVVRSITQNSDRVTVRTDALEVSAAHAVVAIPPALAGEIAFEPELPRDRARLFRR